MPNPSRTSRTSVRRGGSSMTLGELGSAEPGDDAAEVTNKTPVLPQPQRNRIGLDPESMRQRVRESLLKPQYNVADFYHVEGVFQLIARHQLFEKVTLGVIGINALWIWADTDLNDAVVFSESQPVFQVVEHFFCLYFSLEWFTRFMAFKSKRNCCRDSWFAFDSILVLTMVSETWVMTSLIFMLKMSVGGGGDKNNASILRMARLLRLSRMARMIRLFRHMPEILILVKGMAAAARSVCFTLLLLLFLLYIFAIALRQLTEGSDSGKRYFGSVLGAMYTLLIDGWFMDNLGPTVRRVGDENPVCAVIFWFFVLISSLIVTNMLIGVLCEVVNAVAATEKEAMMVNFVKERMKPLFDHLDESGDGLISKSEFLGILDNPGAAHLLEEVGIDVIFLLDQSDTIFDMGDLYSSNPQEQTEEGSLSFEKLMTVILELRGSNKATVKHIVELRKQVLSALHHTNTLVRMNPDSMKAQKEEALCRHLMGSKKVQSPHSPHSPHHPPSLDEAAWMMPSETPISRDEKDLFKRGGEMWPFWSTDGLRPADEALGGGGLQQESPPRMPPWALEEPWSASSASALAGLRKLASGTPPPPKSKPYSPPAATSGPRVGCDLAAAGAGPRPGQLPPRPISQPGGDRGLPEPSVEISPNDLLRRLERIATEALYQAHQEFLQGIATAVGVAAMGVAAQTIAEDAGIFVELGAEQEVDPVAAKAAFMRSRSPTPAGKPRRVPAKRGEVA